MTKEELATLSCPNCGGLLRPNILWFDEHYNERLYKLDTVLRIAKNTGILFVIGTSGATTLPSYIVENVLQYGGYVIDVNIDENEISKMIRPKKRAVICRETSDQFLGELNNILEELQTK